MGHLGPLGRHLLHTVLVGIGVVLGRNLNIKRAGFTNFCAFRALVYGKQK